MNPTTPKIKRPAFAAIILAAALLAAAPVQADELLGGYTRPTAANTGPVAGTVFAGATTNVITTPYATIQNTAFTGQVTVAASHVTFRNCRFNGNMNNYAISITPGIVDTVIDRCDIRNASSALVLGSDFRLTQSHLHDTYADAIKAGSNSIIQSNFIRYIGQGPADLDVHGDAIQISGGTNIVVQGNHIYVPINECNHSNSALQIEPQPNVGNIDGVLIRYNWLAGGNYAIIAANKLDKNGNVINTVKNIQIIANRFKPGKGTIYRSGIWACKPGTFSARRSNQWDVSPTYPPIPDDYNNQ